MSKFAEEQLRKYGWNEGEGIGKTNQGIVAPIKASFKFDNSGVGFDIADEFTTNWWEHLFNHTAKKIVPSAEFKKEETVAENATAILNRKSLFYARFQKSSVLVDGQTVKVENEEIPVKKEETYDKKGKKIVSDEELFKLCEGRTAHKGARHGIKMNGKLARLEEQEAMFREKTKDDLKEKKRKLEIQEDLTENIKIKKSKKSKE